MSINLTLEKPEPAAEECQVRYTKRIDDLIEDAEIEAEIEAERKIRVKNTKIVSISVVAIGLLGLLYVGIGHQTQTPDPEAIVDSPEVAKAPPEMTPKPIPFPLQSKPNGTPASAPAVRKKTPAASTPKADTPKAKAPPQPSAPAAPAAKTQPAAARPAPVRGTTLQAMNLPPARSLKEPVAPVKSFQASAASPTAAGYFVQVGAFSKKANAERLAKNLKTKGFSSSLDSKTVNRKTVHVVRIGGFANSDKAQSAQSRLIREGYKKAFIYFSKTG